MCHRPNRRTLVALIGAWAFTTGTAVARAGTAPLLRVEGRTKSGSEVLLDRDAIWSLGSSTLVTSTPWYEGPHRFEGVRLGSLLREIGDVGPTSLHFHALNDYEVDVPMEDVDKYDPLLALRRDGADLLVREKGPLFLVYPFDAHAELQTSRFYSRAIWQIDAMDIR